MGTEAQSAKTLGNAAFSNGNYDESIKHFSRAIELDPKEHVFYSNRSGAYASLQKWKEALNDAKECIKLNPQFIKGYNRAFVALFNLGQYDEAEKIIQEGLKIDPQNQSLKENQNELNRSRSSQSDPMGRMFGPDMWVKLQADPTTRQYLNDPDFVNKIKMIQSDPKLFAQFTSDPKVAAAIGVILGLGSGAFANMPTPPMSTQNPPNFSDDDEEEIEIDASSKSETKPKPQSPPKKQEKPKELKNQLAPEQKEAVDEKEKGNAAYKTKKFDEALKHYQRAITLDENNIIYYNNSAAVYYEMRNFDKAIEIAQKGVEKGREHMASFKDLAKAYGRIGNCYAAKHDYKNAIEYYNKSLVEDMDEKIRLQLRKVEDLKKKADEEAYIDPEKSEEHKAKGNEYFNNGKWVEAIAEYTEALRRNPKNYKVYSNRAACYTKLMEWQRGIDDCDACLAQDPNFVKAYLRKGKIQHFLKQYHKALETYNKALEIDPNATEVLESRRLTLMQINSGESDPERAKEAMKDPEIREILQDPTIQKVLTDLQNDPATGSMALKDQEIRKKIEKLVAAGVLAVK